MPLHSMTGFGRADGGTAEFGWSWELRSVNGRGLDVRLRLAPGFDVLEPKVRERLQARLVRGSVNATLTVRRAEGAADIRLNRQALSVVAEAVAEMRRAIPGQTAVNIDGLLSLRGVLEYVEPTDTDVQAEARQADMLKTLDAALDALVAARRGEGKRLEGIAREQLAEVETLTAEAAASPSRQPAAVAARLQEQIDRVLAQTASALDPVRLHQEAAVIATKNDIEEEVKRLSAHVAAARDLLAAKDPAGRKLDFLTQEFNREANTLCSKAADLDLTRIGLALKAVIDQMREQVQNIE